MSNDCFLSFANPDFEALIDPNVCAETKVKTKYKTYILSEGKYQKLLTPIQQMSKKSLFSFWMVTTLLFLISTIILFISTMFLMFRKCKK